MPDFKKTIATAKAKVAEAETKAFMAPMQGEDAPAPGAVDKWADAISGLSR